MKISTILDHIDSVHRIESVGLPRGVIGYDVFDLAWSNGLQEELSQPVAVLLNEDAAVISLASGAGFRCFVDTGSFKEYVEKNVL